MSDEVIREVRCVRHEISDRCGHDIHRVVAYYREFQDRLKASGKLRFAERAGSVDPREKQDGSGIETLTQP
jgi:hypothetical protein